MTTTELRDELATIRLVGGTADHATRMVTLEMVPTVIAALGAGAVIVAVAVAGVPRGLTGFPLVVPLALTGGLACGAAALGLLAAAVTTRLALRGSPPRPSAAGSDASRWRPTVRGRHRRVTGGQGRAGQAEVPDSTLVLPAAI